MVPKPVCLRSGRRLWTSPARLWGNQEVQFEPAGRLQSEMTSTMICYLGPRSKMTSCVYASAVCRCRNQSVHRTTTIKIQRGNYTHTRQHKLIDAFYLWDRHGNIWVFECMQPISHLPYDPGKFIAMKCTHWSGADPYAPTTSTRTCRLMFAYACPCIYIYIYIYKYI